MKTVEALELVHEFAKHLAEGIRTQFNDRGEPPSQEFLQLVQALDSMEDFIVNHGDEIHDVDISGFTSVTFQPVGNSQGQERVISLRPLKKGGTKRTQK